MERGAYWHQNEEQRNKNREKTSENEGGKMGMRKKRFGGFLKDRNIPSLTINFDKHSNPRLWWDGRERGNNVQTLSLMKRNKRTWKWLCVVEWDEWRHIWMRMSGFQEWEIETREWETTNRDESEIEWYKWFRERQDIHEGVGVFMWCVWVLILWPNMGCVEIDVETDTLK